MTMGLSQTEQELFDGALDVGVQLAMSEHEQHKALGQIIAGLCAIIYKRQLVAASTGGEQERTADK